MSRQHSNNNNASDNNTNDALLAMADTVPPKLQILLIEDSPLLRRLLVENFDEIGGVEVCGFAENEASALEQLETKPVDLAIVDIELKQGSGIGVLQALKLAPERYGMPNKVVFSNYSHASMRQRCASLGIDAFFDKSLQMNELIAYINNKLDERAFKFPI